MPNPHRKHPHDHHDAHSASMTLAQSAVGQVSMCSCGVLTLNLQYLSLRFEPAALRELNLLLNQALHRLDSAAIGSQPAQADTTPTPPPSSTIVH